MHVLSLDGKFSRGRALEEGAKYWSHIISDVSKFHVNHNYNDHTSEKRSFYQDPQTNDVLLFFCDVDIIFTADFLERCRMNSQKASRVYYPIVFSLYNPSIVRETNKNYVESLPVTEAVADEQHPVETKAAYYINPRKKDELPASVLTSLSSEGFLSLQQHTRNKITLETILKPRKFPKYQQPNNSDTITVDFDAKVSQIIRGNSTNAKSQAAYTAQWLISKETGFWRDFGYGMTCQYRSDFLQMDGNFKLYEII